MHVFYGDFYGIPHDNIEPVKDIKTLIQLRKKKHMESNMNILITPII